MKQILTIIFLHLFVAGMLAQNVRTIKGQVTDSQTKEPMVSATVFISPSENEAGKYNPQGVVTDYDGNFLFTLPQSVKKVIVSYVGYEPKEIILNASDTYNVELVEDVNLLEDFVVTGYQRIERRKLTSSVSKVDAENIIQVGAPNVDQLLSGQVAGLVSTPTTGAPGSANKIRIRGTVSLSGSADPLWVLDGIPLEGNDIPKNFQDKDNIDNLQNVSIAGLNPSDIKDITILKDAAATAIYGARAANGVIVVTTKRGQEGKLRINFSSDFFFTMKPEFSRLNLMNATEKVDFELGLLSNPNHSYRSGNGEVSRILDRTGQLDAYKNGGFGAISTEAQQQINGLRTQGHDWANEIYRSTVNQQYGLSLSGGNNIANYYFSTGYYSEQGTTRGSSFDRFNITLNTDFNVTSKLKFRVGLFANQNERQSYLVDMYGGTTNAQNYTRRVNPYLEAYDKDHGYVYDPDLMNANGDAIPFNYIEEQKNTSYNLTTQALKSIFEVNYSIIKPLSFTSQLGLQVENGATEKMADNNTYFTRQYRSQFMYKGNSIIPEGGIIQNWSDRYFQYDWRNQLFFNKMFADRHDFDMMLGLELRRNTYTNIHTKGFGFDENAMTTEPIQFPSGYSEASMKSSALLPYQKTFVENAYFSYFSTASYTLDGKYTLFGSLRYDGSNLFGVDPKYRYLPLWSVSGAWNASREEFFNDFHWMSNLKLRASYGLQGNIDKDTSPFVKGSWNKTEIFPGQYIPIISVVSPPNQYLRWEKTSTTNAGFDIGFVNNRINLSFDWYNRYSSDLLNIKAIPMETGFNFVNLNWAEVSNRGWEIFVSTRNIDGKDFKWSTDFNISQNKSKVHRISVPNNSYMPSLEGYPVGAVFGIETAGVDKETGLMLFKNDKNETVNIQDFYKLQTGVWGDVTSTLSPEEFRKLFKYMGDSEPDVTGGFINRFNYKDFDLSISSGFFLNRTVRVIPFYNPSRVDPGVNYTTQMNNVWNGASYAGNTGGTGSTGSTGSSYPSILGNNGDELHNLAYGWIDSYDPSGSYNYYDIWIKKLSYLRINSIRLGYTLKNKSLANSNISSIRFNIEARNPFVIGTNHDGYFDPENYGNIYAQPIARTISAGFNITF